MSDRRLSEDEIDEIAKKVTEKLQNDLFINVGYGLVSLAWKGVVIILIALAAYGSGKHFL